jgi:heptosyltransferase-3
MSNDSLPGGRVPRRLLVAVTRRIGDVLLATPVLHSLKAHWPATSIDVLVFDGTEGILKGNPDISRIITIAERPTVVKHLGLLAWLFRRYDIAISLVPSDRPTVYAAVAGKRSIGLLLDAPGQRWKQKLVSQWVAYTAGSQHTVLGYLSVLDALGIPSSTEIATSHVQSDIEAVDQLLTGSCTSIAVLHPYPKFRYKMWPAAHWVTLARWLLQQGMRVVISGSADEREREYVRAITAELPPAVVNASGKLSLGGAAALLKRAQFYIGPDTAITHLAAATGIPTIALFGPTDPVTWGPWPRDHSGLANPWRRFGSQRSGNVRLLQGPQPCTPCSQEGCKRCLSSSSDCLDAVSPDLVIDAIKSFAYGR